MFKKINVLFLIILLIGGIVLAQNSEPAVGESELLWVHNFQFFQYDYKIGATLVEKNQESNIWIENNKVTAVTVDEENSVIYVGTKTTGVFKKSLADNSWTSVSDGLPKSSRLSGTSKVNVLFKTSAGMMLAGTDDGMYRWDDGLSKWRKATISDPVWSITEADGNLYAGIGGYVWADDTDEDGDIDIDMGVYTSTNGGLAWSRQTLGMPMDNDDEHLAVYSVENVDGTLVATTEAGVFQSANQGTFWKGVERTIKALPANIKVNLVESALSEDVLKELGESLGPDFERLLAVEGISREDKVIVVQDSMGQAIRKWNCPKYDVLIEDSNNKVCIKPGIVGDEGKWTLKLQFNTRVNPETDFIYDYTVLDINDFKYRGEPATATIIDPESELLLLVSYPEDENFEVGGKYITVEYTDGANNWVWSVKANSLRGLNNEKKGILLDNDHLVVGDPITNYDALNNSDTIAKMVLSTSSGLVVNKLVYSEADHIIYAGSDNGVYKSTDKGKTWSLVGSVTEGLENIDIQSLILDNSGTLYAGTLDNIFKSENGGSLWEALNIIEAQTQIYALAKSGDELIAGTPYGCFITSNDGATWSDHNLGLQVSISAAQLANIVNAVENSTPANPGKGIYKTITDQFGEENVPDTDNNGKVDILFHEIFEKGRSEDQTSNGNYGTTKITGYFRPEDQNLVGNTNRHDFIYIDTGETTESEQVAAIAHQMMRMIIWNNDYDEERWISEGIGYIAEKLCGYKLPTAMPDFKSLTGPATVFSLVSGTPLSPWSVNAENGDMNNRFTMTSMFATYLYENFGGIDFFVRVMQEPANGWIGIQNVLHNEGKAINFDDVYAAWAMTLAVNDVTQNDPITGMRYGYQDSLYSSVLENNKKNYTLGINSQYLFGHTQVMAVYDEYSTHQENTNGLNNWAFVIGYFFPTPSLEQNGDPDSAIVDYWGKDKYYKDPETGQFLDIRYRLNARDDANLRVQLIKMTPEGHFDVENITSTFNDEKELSFNVLSKYEPYKNSENKTLVKYHKMWIMISNQDSLGRSAKFVQVKDNTPPQIQYQLVHNPAYPEFVDIFVSSNEHTFKDVGLENENPTVDMVYFTDTTAVDISTFDYIPSIGNQSEYFFYKGRYHLTEEGEVTLVIRKLQDLPGNDTNDITNTLSVRKAKPQFVNTLSVPNKDALLTLPQGALSEETFITAYENESRAQAGLKKGSGMSVCSDVFSFGPINKSLNKSATLSIKYDKDLDLAKTGLFRQENEKWVSVPAVINTKAGTISASVEKLGVYALLTGDQVESENAGAVELPYTYAVYQNYPNPFNPVTEIKYQLPEQAHVQMQVFNLQGQLVKTLVDQSMEAGYHTVRWNGMNQAGYKVSTGVYFYKINAGSFTETKKMILIK